MRKINSLILCGAVCLAALVGCSGGETAVNSTTWEKDFSSQVESGDVSGHESGEAQEDAADDSQAVDVRSRLAYVGMPADYIDVTWLGPADEVGEKVTSGKYAGATPYRWRAKNGTNDLVFSAYVKDDEVVMVFKSNTGKNYWGSSDGSSALSRELPDLFASGEAVKEKTSQSAKPDPDAWDDPDDYAAANESAFDNYDAAFDYWLEEMS